MKILAVTTVSLLLSLCALAQLPGPPGHPRFTKVAIRLNKICYEECMMALGLSSTFLCSETCQDWQWRPYRSREQQQTGQIAWE